MVTPKKIAIPAATAKAEEKKPKDSELAESQRNQMSWRGNALDAIATLQEGNAEAFDILVDMFGLIGEKRFDHLIKSLDDMNMRGIQIVHAWDHAAHQNHMFEKLVSERDTALINAVNNKREPHEHEIAVKAGAHKWMHLQPSASKPILHAPKRRTIRRIQISE